MLDPLIAEGLVEPAPSRTRSRPRRRGSSREPVSELVGQQREGSKTRAVHDLEAFYDQLDRVDVDDGLVRRAGVLAEHHQLRGFDAIHLAAAERIADDDTVVVAGDAELCRAAHSLRLHVTQLVTREQ